MLRCVILAFVRALGRPIRDCETGEPLGRALVFVWRGKLHVWGIERAIEPRVLPAPTLSYWRHAIGFRAARTPSEDDEARRDGAPGITQPAGTTPP